jgi:hypothetical protein
LADDDAQNVDRAWDLMKRTGFAMLVTRDVKRAAAAVTGIRPDLGENRKAAM